MLDVVLWYLALQGLGVAALPLASRLLANLPDRGFAFARPLGLLIASYILWLAATFGVLDNRFPTPLLIVVGLGLASWTLLPRETKELRELWRQRRWSILAIEGLFLAAYLAGCQIRSILPDITGTEKPMEFAFLNAILRSRSFPPADPWLSGYSISYYYFGYVMACFLTQLTAISSKVAFNLTVATLFALTVTGSFSIGTLLAEGIRERQRASGGRTVATNRSGVRPWIAGTLAVVFVAVLGNWEGVLELFHAHGFGSPGFWRQVAIDHLDHPYHSPHWYPNERQDNWWWFRASRVIATAGADGKAVDYTINEFPFFSFLLGDVHPHVLALPFAFLALAFAINLLRPRKEPLLGACRTGSGPEAPVRSPDAHTQDGSLWMRIVGLLPSTPWSCPIQAVGLGLVFGGLGFLNAWDFPTYLFVLIGAFAIQRRRARGRFDADWCVEVLTFAGLGLAACVLFYLPFYIGFRSQASGFAQVRIRSRLDHFLLYWGPILFAVVSFLIVELVRPNRSTGSGIRSKVGLFAGLLFILLLVQSGAHKASWLEAPALVAIVPLLAVSLTLLTDSLTEEADESLSGQPEQAPEHLFILLLSFTGLLLVLGTELVFVRDLFGNRMNTVFKLYYQARVMLALVAAHGIYCLAARWPEAGASFMARLGANVWLAGGLVAVAGGLVYAPAATLSRIEAAGDERTLDGTIHEARANPEDHKAILWLRQNVVGNPVIVEAPGGSYSRFGRVSEHTGLPTILGWDFHEAQWRGSFVEPGLRQADLELIYRSTDMRRVVDLLRKYGVSFVFVGPLEVEKYGRPDRAGLDKFARFMDTAYQGNGVTIYRVRGSW